MKNKLKRILDIVMTLMLPCLMAYELIGQEIHEILGLCMVSLFILHHAMNWQWHKNLFKGNRSRSEIVATFLAILELCKTSSVTLEDDVNGENPNVRLLDETEKKEMT